MRGCALRVVTSKKIEKQKRKKPKEMLWLGSPQDYKQTMSNAGNDPEIDYLRITEEKEEQSKINVGAREKTISVLRAVGLPDTEIAQKFTELEV